MRPGLVGDRALLLSRRRARVPGHSFFKELETAFGAPGDFAEAYVIAHEVAHHVQTLLGTNAEVQRMSQEDPDIANELSVRLELQADCFARRVGAVGAGRRDPVAG